MRTGGFEPEVSARHRSSGLFIDTSWPENTETQCRTDGLRRRPSLEGMCRTGALLLCLSIVDGPGGAVGTTASAVPGALSPVKDRSGLSEMIA